MGELTLKEYQEAAAKTAVYPGRFEVTGLMYVALGLAGEAGEIANKIKKIWRDNKSQTGIADELGDVLWYVSQVASEIGVPLDVIAERNLDKLADRQKRGVIGGSGDTR